MPRLSLSAPTRLAWLTALALASAPAWAGPPSPKHGPAAAPASPLDDEGLIELAIDAWRKGDWTEVRDLLEPVLRDNEGIEDPTLRETGLRYLAEATLYDEGLEENERTKLARGYVERLLDQSAEWTPPSGLHGAAFYDLVARVRRDREAASAAACQDHLLACETKLTELKADHRALIERANNLQFALDKDQVQVTKVIQRNRGLAVIPFGVGHFTNASSDRKSLPIGITFLSLEVLTGGAGLGLLIWRSTVGCRRTAGFTKGSLQCAVVEDEQVAPFERLIQDARSAETVMAASFLGLVVLDVILAQVFFEEFSVVEEGLKTREQLEAEAVAPPERRSKRKREDEADEPALTPTQEGPREPGDPLPGSSSDPDEPASDLASDAADDPQLRAAARARERRFRNAILLVRPSSAPIPSGAGLGVRLDF